MYEEHAARNGVNRAASARARTLQPFTSIQDLGHFPSATRTAARCGFLGPIGSYVVHQWPASGREGFSAAVDRVDRASGPGCDLTPLRPTFRYVSLRYVTLRFVTFRYATLRYATLRYVTSAGEYLEKIRSEQE